jgi:guanine nucleotide-binding protein subunit alpha
VFYRDVPDDPWASFLSPPTNETREERSERLARERHAKEVSDEIDAEIEKERELET